LPDGRIVLEIHAGRFERQHRQPLRLLGGSPLLGRQLL
jgi:hypothetical protein